MRDTWIPPSRRLFATGSATIPAKKAREQQRFDAWRERVGDRFCEPFHLNILSTLVSVFGSYDSKVAFDLVRRRHYAYSVLRAADLAGSQHLSSVTIAEFGVATGAGLLDLCKLAQLTTEETGIEVRVVGFDIGSGLPPPINIESLRSFFRKGTIR